MPQVSFNRTNRAELCFCCLFLKCLSQRDLAALVGIDFTYLSKIERGQLAPPSESVIRHLAQALDTDEDDLINHAGKIPPDLKVSLRNNPILSELLRVLSERRLPDEVYCKMLVLIQEQTL